LDSKAFEGRHIRINDKLDYRLNLLNFVNNA
jgi:hypothetical protein